MHMQAIQQTPAWLRFQNNLPERKGWEIDGFFVFQLSLSAKLKFLYLPGIATLPTPQTWSKLISLAKENSCSFIHCEPYFSPSTVLNIKSSRSPLQYIIEQTRYLDLSLSSDALLANMKSKCRYNIRLAKKQALTIKEESTTTNFYHLLKETALRDKFAINNESFYAQMLNRLTSTHCKIWTAFHDSTPIASVLITLADQTATYYYGASANEYRNLMAPYLLHWHVIEWAQQAGYKTYDLLGIAPENAKPSHRLFGVSRFKAQFGGKVFNFHQAFDIIINPLRYWPYAIYKRFR